MPKSKGGRPLRNPTPTKYIQLPLRQEQHEMMKARAAEDGLDLTVWIKYTCLQELRRRKRTVV
jgi:hypothetical protein